jgi:3-isopropylmalate/(R)-2-methylmalate dehydratase small subunit
MSGFQTITSRCVVLPIDNIDTDRIIPARFLKTTERSTLGGALFADWKSLPDGTANPDFPAAGSGADGVQVMLAGHNFGCGSSREHAPWALLGAGFRAVISTGFADIFRSNALKNNLLAITVDEDSWREVADAVRANPNAELSIDLREGTLKVESLRAIHFTVEAFARECLLEGVDELGYLVAREHLRAKYESSNPALVSTI